MTSKLNDLMKEAQKMQEKMQQAQEELKNIAVQGQSGGGLVKIKMNGQRYVTQMTIDKTVIDPNDPKMLQDLIIAAINDAAHKIEKETWGKMTQLTRNLNLPLNFGLPPFDKSKPDKSDD